MGWNFDIPLGSENSMWLLKLGIFMEFESWYSSAILKFQCDEILTFPWGNWNLIFQ